MHTRVLDLDGSIVNQTALLRRCAPDLLNLRGWGPRVRLGCSFRAFADFEAALAMQLTEDRKDGPALTFVGSGDFHHVSLALLRRLCEPFNLLILDNHPDWMRAVPFIHCGTWVYHAARLPLCQRIFHLGGTRDFDNGYQGLAPWKMLHSGKITVLPAVDHYTKGNWKKIDHEPLRRQPDMPLGRAQVQQIVDALRADLRGLPLYISLDKDVMEPSDAVVNWDSGRLTLAEVKLLIEELRKAVGGNLAGVDVVGDASAVKLEGFMRHVFDWLEKSNRPAVPDDATQRNQRTNLALLSALGVAPKILPFAEPQVVHSA